MARSPHNSPSSPEATFSQAVAGFVEVANHLHVVQGFPHTMVIRALLAAAGNVAIHLMFGGVRQKDTPQLRLRALREVIGTANEICRTIEQNHLLVVPTTEQEDADQPLN